jgi:putative ABC transport system permease protein
LADFLPVEVNYSISWTAIGQGILLGVTVSVLFALLPLLRVRRISPLHTLRASYEEKKPKLDFYQVLAYVLILAFIYFFAYSQIKSWRESAYFTAFILLSLAILGLMARLLMWAVKRFFPVSWNYLWRQSIANLYRPNNQTAILILTIGLGTGLISTLYVIQDTLLTQVTLSDNDNQPNLILFDIQTEQQKEVNQLVKKYDLPIRQQLPIVAMRLAEYKGRSRQAWLEDSVNSLPRDVLNREYRVSYRDTLDTNEKLLEGKLGKPINSPNDSIFISVSDNHAERMEAKVGDEIIFNVQGTPIRTFIGSIRKLDLTQFRTSFTFIFPSGVLEEAPQFYVLITRTKSKEQSAKFQQALIQKFPNVSAVDISLIIESVQKVLDKVSFVIQFMALFSILTGILVLLASVRISRYQRVQESVLLRTLGARRGQIFWINALEYFFLGSLASLTGIGLSVLGSWALIVYLFELDFQLNVIPLMVIFLFITGLTVLIGLLNSRGVVSRPPLEVLRE